MSKRVKDAILRDLGLIAVAIFITYRGEYAIYMALFLLPFMIGDVLIAVYKDRKDQQQQTTQSQQAQPEQPAE